MSQIRYNNRDKFDYYRKRAEKGAKAADGSKLSDYGRGYSAAKAEMYGQRLGDFKLKKALESGDQKQINAVKAERAKRAEDKRANRERMKAEKAAIKAEKKAAKAGGTKSSAGKAWGDSRGEQIGIERYLK